MQIFLGMLLHKIVIGFSLGVRLVQSALSLKTVLLCSTTFAAQIIVGGFGGIAILDFVSSGSPHTACKVSFVLQVINSASNNMQAYQYQSVGCVIPIYAILGHLLFRGNFCT